MSIVAAIKNSYAPLKRWDLFVRAFALAFLSYWLHLDQALNNWLGTEGFHVPSWGLLAPTSLSYPWPQFLWWSTFIGGCLLFFRRSVPTGCLLAGFGFFYATFRDPSSANALNMHMLFALTIILWSSQLRVSPNGLILAWPVYLMRIYLVTVYFGSGWRKAVFGNWLSDPNALFQSLGGYFTTPATCWIHLIAPSFTWTILQYLTLAFELGAPLLFLYYPLRNLAITTGCLLHMGIAVLMKGLFYFSFQMIVFYIPFLIPLFISSSAESKSDLDLNYSKEIDVQDDKGGKGIFGFIQSIFASKNWIPFAFILFWIVPVAWVGLMRNSFPLYPEWIAPLFRVTGVFENAPPQWRIYFIEAKNGYGNWHYVDEKTLFAATPLGNRTRFQPLMNEIEKLNPKESSNLLEWVAPHLPDATGIRIISFDIPLSFFFDHPSFRDLHSAAHASRLHPTVIGTLNLVKKELH